MDANSDNYDIKILLSCPVKVCGWYVIWQVTF